MKTFELVIHVKQTLLSTVLDALEGAADVRKLEPIAEAAPVAIAAKARHHYVGGKRNKGISSTALALEILADRRVHNNDDFGRTFEARKFARNSASAALSRLQADGKVVNVGNGLWALPGVVGQHDGASPNGSTLI